MTDDITANEPHEWPTHCPVCGTALEQAVVDFDPDNEPRPEMRPGEMVTVDFCPNAECAAYRQPVGPDDAVAETGPGSLGGDNGGA
ncbi:hypothetical protein [Nocardioides mesophilus]|uniref:Uncharacterized protein n=1 Tax=Nocardioides mesophilus TaxID=433659 RepID=A0A7G9REQ8_9ACTN|nr:hypothetical protein [Nocardioides mesophilus]QNN54083.1 hypothetical protein H9L09_06820 [Nocardioides mesophilus]